MKLYFVLISLFLLNFCSSYRIRFSSDKIVEFVRDVKKDLAAGKNVKFEWKYLVSENEIFSLTISAKDPSNSNTLNLLTKSFGKNETYKVLYEPLRNNIIRFDDKNFTFKMIDVLNKKEILLSVQHNDPSSSSGSTFDTYSLGLLTYDPSSKSAALWNSVGGQILKGVIAFLIFWAIIGIYIGIRKIMERVKAARLLKEGKTDEKADENAPLIPNIEAKNLDFIIVEKTEKSTSPVEKKAANDKKRTSPPPQGQAADIINLDITNLDEEDRKKSKTKSGKSFADKIVGCFPLKWGIRKKSKEQEYQLLVNEEDFPEFVVVDDVKNLKEEVPILIDLKENKDFEDSKKESADLVDLDEFEDFEDTKKENYELEFMEIFKKLEETLPAKVTSENPDVVELETIIGEVQPLNRPPSPPV